ncbi:Golgi organization protein [Malassezia pachydermatis]
MIEKMEGQMITLNVWNSKRQEYRDVNLVPSRAWAETHTSSQDQPSLLGLTLRLCNPLDTISHVWHVLDVVEGSPADSAGLVPYGDYILGWTGGPLQKEHDFFQLVEQYANHNLALYVYNSDYDHTREVVIMPNRDWGGEGLLGCGIGFGLLRKYVYNSY